MYLLPAHEALLIFKTVVEGEELIKVSSCVSQHAGEQTISVIQQNASQQDMRGEKNGRLQQDAYPLASDTVIEFLGCDRP